jgi:orotidine-5'-phosphate decarboxylase
MAGLIIALDTADAGQATAWAEMVAPHCGILKLGLQFVLAQGLLGVRGVAPRPIFLDLKLHDIPNTVAGAVHAVLPLRPMMLTVHAGGGSAMLEAARRAADSVSHPPLLLAVTVLTSLDSSALHATGVAGGPRQQVLRLARLAMDAGADGLVCSAQEAPMLRDALGSRPTLVVPGIRPAGAAVDDQARTVTPRAAVDAGADWIVVGRPITGSADPGAAAAAIASEIA